MKNWGKITKTMSTLEKFNYLDAKKLVGKEKIRNVMKNKRKFSFFQACIRTWESAKKFNPCNKLTRHFESNWIKVNDLSYINNSRCESNDFSNQKLNFM